MIVDVKQVHVIKKLNKIIFNFSFKIIYYIVTMISVIAYVIKGLTLVDEEYEEMNKRCYEDTNYSVPPKIQRIDSMGIRKTESLTKLNEIDDGVPLRKPPKATYYTSSNFYYNFRTDSCATKNNIMFSCHMCEKDIPVNETIYCYCEHYFHQNCFRTFMENPPKNKRLFPLY